MRILTTLVCFLASLSPAFAQEFALEKGMKVVKGEAAISGGDATAGVILLLLLGAVIFSGGAATGGFASGKSAADTEEDDSDIIMKF